LSLSFALHAHGLQGRNHLQDVGSETEETSKASTGGSERLVGGTSEGRGLAGGGGGCGRNTGGGRGGGGAVGEDGRWRRSGRDEGLGGNGDRRNWGGDGARAVGDGQGGGRRDGVGHAVLHDLSGGRAVGGVGSDDGRGVDHRRGTVGVAGRGTSREGSNSSDGVTHFDGRGWY